jgi:hypothetical protein
MISNAANSPEAGKIAKLAAWAILYSLAVHVYSISLLGRIPGESAADSIQGFLLLTRWPAFLSTSLFNTWVAWRAEKSHGLNVLSWIIILLAAVPGFGIGILVGLFKDAIRLYYPSFRRSRQRVPIERVLRQ